MSLTAEDVTEKVHTALGQAGRHDGVVVAAVAGPETVITGRGTTGQDGAPGEDTVFQIGSITKVFTALALADGNPKDIRPASPCRVWS